MDTIFGLLSIILEF